MATRSEPDQELERLLGYLRDARAFDFTGYKRASLSRRIQRRMQTVGVDDYATYIGILEANPGEFAELCNTILINVTSFRRDPEAWDFLAAEVVPAMVDGQGGDQPVRVWSAGCASGEEAYTLAVLLAEQLGEDRFRASVQIYATDVDDAALAAARQARYATDDVVAAFGEERRHRFFETDGAACVFRPDLRRTLIFGRHDLASDPPISRIDVLSCRNTLMYFTAEMQQRVLAGFHFALTDRGFLFLGKSEAMVSRMAAFEAINLKHRVFRRLPGEVVPRPAPPDVLTVRPAPAAPDDGWLRAAFEGSPIAQLFIDAEANAAIVNRHARTLLGLGLDDVGRPFKDLQVSYRPVELRSVVDEVLATHRPVAVQDVEWTPPDGEAEYLDIMLLPVDYGEVTGVVVTFIQVGRYKVLRDELESSQRDLEDAYEELQSTVEELETTNEELQSTNEELQTTNEELHSSNEELETMNEELQSTNEELETANVELRVRGGELNQANQFLESILGSLRSGVVVLNAEMTVRAWNRRAEDLWGLRAQEVEGSHFLNLDIGLPVDRLRAPIRACLAGTSDGEELTVPALNRRGRTVDCAVTVSPLRVDDQVLGTILVMDT